LYGAGRVEDDLLKQKPDFIVIEYSVNDVNEKKFAETVEGIIRQTLKSPKKPAVMILFTLNENGDNAQEWHSRGHKICSNLITRYLELILKNKKVDKEKKIPAPLFTDIFEHAERFRGKNFLNMRKDFVVKT